MATTSSAFLGKNEPHFQWAFFIIIPELGDLTPLYVATAALPSVTWETAESAYFFTTRKYASRFTINETSITIKDYVSNNTALALWNWWLSVGDAQLGSLRSPADYKKNAELISTDGRGNAINTWILEGCWPSAMEFGDLDYSGTDIVQMNVTITTDMVSL
jgi:hypothetical protein